MRKTSLGALALLAFSSCLLADDDKSNNGKSKNDNTFKMVVSGGAASCLPNATATVKITPTGPVEIMNVTVRNLPPNTDFDLFILQVPKGPFGVAWYQGDIETDEDGEGSQQFIGRFNIETFAVSQSPSVAAPVVHNPPQSLVSDASSNPAFEPIHTFHLGLWFNSPADATKANCPGTETRFNGEHNAGIQVLNTANFPDLAGPLKSTPAFVPGKKNKD